jgi:hypothetical protein
MINGDYEYELRNAGHKSIPNLTPSKDPDLILSHLIHLVKFQMLRGLKNSDKASPLPNKSKFQAIDAPTIGFFDEIERGGWFELRLEFTVIAGQPSKIYLPLSPEGRNHSLISGFPRCIVYGNTPPAGLRSMSFVG